MRPTTMTTPSTSSANRKTILIEAAISTKGEKIKISVHISNGKQFAHRL